MRLILALATLLAVVAIFAVWADRQLLNPENWSRTSTQLLQKETIRTALAGYLVDQLYAHVDVPAQLKTGLPNQLQPLAGPLSGALHGVAEQGAARALATPLVQSVWEKANRAADQTLVAIVNGGGRRVQIEGGTVSLNLRQIVTDLAGRLGLPSSVAEKLPPSVASLKVVTSRQLGLVRNMAKGLHALAIWLTVLVLLLYAFAMYLARGYRRRTLMWIGLSLVISGLLVLVARKITQAQIISSITSDASIEPAANDAYSVATSLLAQVAGATILIGVPVILAAWFAGPARWAAATRLFLAPHVRERPGLAYWITAGLLALLFIWAPLSATRNVLWMLVLTILAFAGAHIGRAQILAEFPDAEAVSLRASLLRRAHAMGEKISPVRALGALAALGTAPASTAAEIEHLAALHERGVLSDEEFTAAKRELLGVGRGT